MKPNKSVSYIKGTIWSPTLNCYMHCVIDRAFTSKSHYSSEAQLILNVTYTANTKEDNLIFTSLN